MATGQQKSKSVSKSDITTFNTTKDETWTPSEWSSVSDAIPDYSIITALSLKMEFYQLTANGNYKIIAGSTTLKDEQSGVGDHSHTLDVLSYVTKTGANAGTLTSNIILRVSSGFVTRTWKNIKATLTWTYTTPTFKISLTAGTGGTVSGAGTYEVGSSATIKATPNTGYRFVKWSDGNTSATRTITKTTSDISANVTNLSYSAVFEKITYTATFKNYDGTVLQTVTVDSGSTPSYTGSTPTRASTAEYTYAFSGWSPAVGAITANTTYTAQFTATKRKYTVSVSAENGSVSGGGTYEYGSSIALTPTPNDGYAFKQWSDGNTDNPRTVTVTGDVTYTAEFEAAMPEFTLVQMLYNNKQISKDNKVPAGQSFRLVAGVK